MTFACGSVTGRGAASDWTKSVFIFSGSSGADVLSGSASVCVCAGTATGRRRNVGGCRDNWS